MNGQAAFFRPGSLREALELLGGDLEAKPISGGASLVAMMNARLVEPRALVSLARIPELSGIAIAASGDIRIGAATRHREIAGDMRLSGTLAVLPDAARQIGSAAIRNMGTIGGAVAHADPGLDLPPALVAADAAIEVASASGGRRIAVREFFLDWYATAIEPGELVVAIHLPRPKSGAGRYLKLARVSGDYATVSVAVSLANDGEARVAVGGCGPAPLSSPEADRILSANTDKAALKQAGELLVAIADPIDDVRGSAEYRKLLIPRMVAQAVGEAVAGLRAAK
jgi:carbon-monoxide dehydrogenase medium subunit